MKAGDILLFKSEKKFSFSWWIEWGTNSKYSHVAVCVSPEMALAIEAMVGKGVRAIDTRRIPRETYDIYRVKEHHAYDLNKVISYLVNKLNNRYDLIGVIFLGFLKICSKIGLPFKNIANRFQIDKDYFCSELCYEAFHRGGGLDIVPEVPEADVTSPGDISKSSVIEIVNKEVSCET